MKKYEVHIINGSAYRVEIVEAESGSKARNTVELKDGETILMVKEVKDSKPREKKSAIVTVVYLVKTENGYDMVRQSNAEVFGCSGTGKNAVRDIRGLLRDMYPEAVSPFYIETINGTAVE